MKWPRLRTLLLAPVVALLAFYALALVVFQFSEATLPPPSERPSARKLAIFGASGTAGDGLLKAALADPDVERIEIFTRRITPRIEAGVASGKVRATTHMNYFDYAAIREAIADVEAVFWAIGISALKVDEPTYSKIHIDFPVAFVTQWLDASQRPQIAFHYISSSDISEDSSAHWAREKYRAEQALTALAQGTKLKVVHFRPDYIGPTAEEEHLGQRLLYGLFAPVGVAVKARQIGQAMLEVTARPDEFAHGDRLPTRAIVAYSDRYEMRIAETDGP